MNTSKPPDFSPDLPQARIITASLSSIGGPTAQNQSLPPKIISRMYEMNAKSVALQYGDKKISEDGNEYKAEFSKYMKIADNLYTKAGLGNIAPLKSASYDFHDFCRSVNYQIEDPKLSAEVNKFMNKAQMFLLGVLSQVEHHECECWGSFDIEEV